MGEPQTRETTEAEPVGAAHRSGAEWARKYPPLVTILIALVLAIAVLPSALNLPQTNPTQTLEYAPVPPEESDDPPPAGNLSSLGLGSSSGVAEDAEGGTGPGGTLPPPLPGGRGVNPSTKRCVGNPPRQTEDPTSPPCVAFFAGNNFGATYQGVTPDEIRVLIYISGGISYSGSSKNRAAVSPSGAYFDLLEPPKNDEFLLVAGFRSWQRYFNDRFQTYGRLVHFFLYFDDCAASCSPESRRAHAADNYAQVKPFAVLTDVAFGGNEVDYVAEMARRGVLNFGTLTGKSETFFRRFPKLIWGYDPTIEYQAEAYSTFVCQKVVGKPAVLAGGTLKNQPRKLGLFHTSDENHGDRIKLAELVQQKVQACGGEIAATATFPVCCYSQDTRTSQRESATNMSQFADEGITTILWPGGLESSHANAAFGQGYYPEWILLGDDYLDANGPNRAARNGPAFDDKAIVVTPEVFEPARAQQRCYQAFREADQQLPEADAQYLCPYYRNLFQLFVGIQVAGPRLGPASVDKGYHAIPAVPSRDNQSPACYYEPGDYNCVKDNQIEIWDDQSLPADGSNRAGCWRIIANATRYIHPKWPGGNIDTGLDQRGPCNNYSVPSGQITGVPQP